MTLHKQRCNNQQETLQKHDQGLPWIPCPVTSWCGEVDVGGKSWQRRPSRRAGQGLSLPKWWLPEHEHVYNVRAEMQGRGMATQQRHVLLHTVSAQSSSVLAGFICRRFAAVQWPMSTTHWLRWAAEVAISSRWQCIAESHQRMHGTSHRAGVSRRPVPQCRARIIVDPGWSCGTVLEPTKPCGALLICHSVALHDPSWSRCSGCPRNRWLDQLPRDNGTPPVDTRGWHCGARRLCVSDDDDDEY